MRDHVISSPPSILCDGFTHRKEFLQLTSGFNFGWKSYFCNGCTFNLRGCQNDNCNNIDQSDKTEVSGRKLTEPIFPWPTYVLNIFKKLLCKHFFSFALKHHRQSLPMLSINDVYKRNLSLVLNLPEGFE